MNPEERPEKSESIVDDDLVSFFDLLAQYDFEDKKKEASGLETGPSPLLKGQF